MQATKTKSRRKRLLKILLVLLTVFTFVIVGLHFWFVNNARNVLIQMVEKKSAGKIKLKLVELSFNFFSNSLKIREADVVSVDSLQATTTYHVQFRKLTLRVRSFWPLIFKKQLLLDSIKLHDPLVEIYQWRKDTSLRKKDDISISREMGKMYNSMLDVLDEFGIRRIKINNAKVSIINKMHPKSEPSVISDIYLDLIRNGNGLMKRDKFIVNEQNVELRTSHQEISLPGGRHKIAFKYFKLQLFQKRIELDSCTITAKATDSTSGYVIFFKRLVLAGVDFEAMDRLKLIRADSVYCVNPVFNINFNTLSKTLPNKKKPDLDEMIHDLSGDLDLAYIGVKDAGININIFGKKNRSLANTNKDNFEMRGLKIIADSAVPVSVKQFDMLVRDYRLHNADSSVVYAFDSVHFLNHKISLSNFSITTDLSRGTPRNFKNIRIPFFELTGVDWYQLIFDENLTANEALLYKPEINLIVLSKTTRKKKTNLFSTLQTLDDVMALNRIGIIDGKINMKVGTTSVGLDNVQLNLRSNNLLRSTSASGLGRAVEHLSFKNGRVKIKDMTAEMHDVRYTGNNLIHANKLFLSGTGATKISADISDVYINNLLMDNTETTVIDGIRWSDGQLMIKTSGPGKDKASGGNLMIKNISGKNTSLKYITPANEISSFISSVHVGSIQKKGKAPLKIKDFHIIGNDLLVNGKTLRAKATSYDIIGDGPSYLSQVKGDLINDRDSFSFASPRISFTPGTDALSSNDMHITTLMTETPVINIRKWNLPVLNPLEKKAPAIRIDQFETHEPVIQITLHRNDSVNLINIPWSANSSINASNIVLKNGETRVGKIAINTTSATIATAAGRLVGVEKGKMEVELADLQLGKKNGKPFWSTIVNKFHIQNPYPLAVGKNNHPLNLDDIELGNLNLNSDLTDVNELFKFNLNAWLRTGTGNYTDSTLTLKWYNAAYNSSTKIITVDSFNYAPTQTLDTFLARKKFQDDYITFRSGKITLTDFNLDKYSKDSSFIAGILTVVRPNIWIYRDKFQPAEPGVYKPLPVDMIRKIGIPIFLKSVNFVNGYLSYTERQKKSRAEGTVILARLNAKLAHIYNRDFKKEDSLSLVLNAYLMDSALINLRIRQSYTDSLRGFLMSLRMHPGPFTFLNPVLAPMSNVMIASGTIDSFYLRTIGRDDLAVGEMNMFYRNLRIKLVKDGVENKTSFLSRTLTFLVNTFLIKKKNEGTPGLIYFVRQRDHSFFNYVVRMALSGMSTSIGIKKNRKVRKMYERELKKKVLPPLEFE